MSNRNALPIRALIAKVSRSADSEPSASQVDTMKECDMKTRNFAPSAAAAIAVLLLVQAFVQNGFSADTKNPAGSVSRAGKATPKLVESIGRLPLRFEVNQGQIDQRAQFISRGPGYTLFLDDNGVVLTLMRPSQEAGADRLRLLARAPESLGHANRRSDVMRLQLLGANAKAKPVGLEESPGKSNYYIGKDPAKWHTQVPAYSKVKYQNVYPGIDLVYYGNGQQLEYDFVLAPGADPKAIHMAVVNESSARSPSASVAIDARGDLVVHSADSEVRFHKPVLYQVANDGQRIPVEGQYLLSRKGELSFEIAGYDRSKPLVIDPTLVYSTHLGGSDGAALTGVARDRSGNIYVTGASDSPDFPIVPPPVPHGMDCYLAKIRADGTALDYVTYVGGSGYEYCNGVAVDASGNAYVAGTTNSTDFPVQNAFQSTLSGDSDAFIAKVNSDGTLGYATYLGGSLTDFASAIAVDSVGTVYVAGTTDSTDFPTLNAFQAFHGGSGKIYYTNRDAFAAKFDPSGVLVFSTFLGGSNFYSEGDDYGYAVGFDGSGNAYVVGETSASDFPTTGNAPQPLPFTFPGPPAPMQGQGFVSKISADGSSLLYSTYLSGGGDTASGVVVDPSGIAYVTGSTNSRVFPNKNSLQIFAPLAASVSFVTKLDTNQSGTDSILFSTFLGGSNSRANAIALDDSGNVYVVGYTGATDFPTTPDALQTSFKGYYDAFLVKIDPNTPRWLYSTYLGGTNDDEAKGVAVAGTSVYVVGNTFSADFPTTANAIQPALNGLGDGFVTKFFFQPFLTLPDPIAQTVALDGSSSATFAITSTDGFDQSVTFDVIAVPVGMTVSPQHFVLTPPPNGTATQTLSFAIGPSVTPGTYTLQVLEEGTVNSVPVTVTVFASSAGATQVVGSIQTAGCISSPNISSVLIGELNLAQGFSASGQIQLAIDTYGAMLVEIFALKSQHLIASSCIVAGASFDPALVLTTDIRSLAATLHTNSTPNPITGYVVESHGLGVFGATVSLLDSGNAVVVTATTDVTGFYFFPTSGVLAKGANYTAKVTRMPKVFHTSTPPSQVFAWSGSGFGLPSFVLK